MRLRTTSLSSFRRARTTVSWCSIRTRAAQLSRALTSSWRMLNGSATLTRAIATYLVIGTTTGSAWSGLLTCSRPGLPNKRLKLTAHVGVIDLSPVRCSLSAVRRAERGGRSVSERDQTGVRSAKWFAVPLGYLCGFGVFITALLIAFGAVAVVLGGLAGGVSRPSQLLVGASAWRGSSSPAVGRSR